MFRLPIVKFPLRKVKKGVLNVLARNVAGVRAHVGTRVNVGQ